MARIHVDEADKYQNELNGEWFQLKNNGDIARVQFMYETYDEVDAFACHKVMVGDKERYVDCLRAYDEPIDNCPFCAAGLQVKPVRFVIMFQHDDQKVKIWERGKQFMTKLQGLFNRYQPLSDYVFEIERFGAAGDKKTKYEVFVMDRAEPFDLTEIEKPELLGGLILDKSFEDMVEYLETGAFPEVDENVQAQPAQRTPARNTNTPSRAGVQRRGAATTSAQPTQPQNTNRPAQSRGGAAPSGGTQISSRRGAATVNNDEVF